VQVYVTAGTQYLIGVNGAGRGARNYNPITGAGAVRAPINSLGTYRLSINAQINRRSGTRRNDILVGRSGIDVFNGGAGNDRLAGLAGSDILIGGLGRDTLIGGLAGDLLNGGLGNDIYYVDRARDRIVETSRNPREIDTVVSKVNYVLGANLEGLNLGGRAIAGIGNSRNNRIVGNNFSNRLSGGTGNDTLIGAGKNDILKGSFGNDILTGGTGNDILVGGTGRDTLIGGAGRDRFVFQTRNQGIDRISGFSTVFDRIDFSAAGFGRRLRRGFLAAPQFRFGSRALDASDRFIYNRTRGILAYDSDGTGALAPTAIAILNPGTALFSSDIYIIA
jgi:Ca2+-binding RTX toxin-like protein